MSTVHAPVAPVTPSATTPAHQPTAPRPRLLREALLVAGVWLLYSVGRWIAAGDIDAAFTNAELLRDLERGLQLPDEQALQSSVLGWTGGLRAANAYYAGVQLPLTFAVLAWLFWRRPVPYGWIRSALLTATLAGLVVHLLYPLAPPRMLPEHGFVNTGVLLGQSVYGSPAANSLANRVEGGTQPTSDSLVTTTVPVSSLVRSTQPICEGPP